MKAFVMAYWTNLNERERFTLGIGVVFCFFYLYYLLLYAPLSHAVYTKSQQLLEKQETLSWMEHVRKSANLKRPTQSITRSQLLTVLANQLNTTSFKQFPYQLQQSGDSEITLIFERVPYTPFIVWVRSFNAKYRLSIKQLTVLPADAPGVVKLTIVITTK